MNRTVVLLVAALVVTTLVSAGTAVYALAGHQPDSVLSITGCVTGTGKLVKVKVGDVPKQPCAGATQVHLSGGDITAVLTPTGGGILGGATNGEASLTLGEGFKLPQSCNVGAVAKRSGPLSWACGQDSDTQYSGEDFAVSDQACPTGAIVTGIDANGKLVCGRSIVSANGQSRIDVDDSEVRVTALGARVFAQGVQILGAVAIGSPQTPTQILGETIKLNGASCPPVARKGDAVVVNPQNGVGSVVTGSPTVFAC